MRLIHRNVLWSRSTADRIEPPATPLRIYWTTDCHVYSPADGGCGEDPEHPTAVMGNRYFYTGPAKTRHFVDEVNAAHATAPVDLVMHTGDMLERGRDWSYFHQWWGDINPAIPQVVVPGNHDFADAPSGLVPYEVVAEGLGRDQEPMIARSQFNRSFALTNGESAYRVIVFDTNMNVTGTHLPITMGIIHDDVLAWIEDEIDNSPEDNILLVSHHSTHEFVGGHFTEASAMALKGVVDAAVAARPSLRFASLFGHAHRAFMRTWSSLGPNLPGYSAAAACELESTHYCVVLAYPDSLIVEEYALVYPHPADAIAKIEEGDKEPEKAEK